MRKSAEMGPSGQTGVRPVAGEEEEAVHKLRVALQNPHGTTAENRDRVSSAWQKLRSVANSPDVQIKSHKRQRKRDRLEEKAKKRNQNGDKKIEGENASAHSADAKREEDKMLHEAARLGQADRVRELISLGAKVSSKDNSGYSALHWASLYGHVEVSLFPTFSCSELKHLALAVGKRSDLKCFILMNVPQSSVRKVVRLLLGLGAGDGKRINRQNDSGNTALHLACIGHHAQVAAVLQIYRPDEYLMNAYDQSPVSLGLRELVQSVETIQKLDNLQASRSNFHQRLLRESLDWRMGRDSECEATMGSDIMGKNSSGREASRGWEDYEIAWKKFVERFTVTSGTELGETRSTKSLQESVGAEALPVDVIHFQDVPWPVTRAGILTGSHIHGDGAQGKERLLLAELGVKRATLRALIQRERLRWHPDKFLQLFGRLLPLDEKSAILAGVQTVCQLLNSLADGTEELGQ